MLQLLKSDFVLGLVDLFDHVPEDLDFLFLCPEVLNQDRISTLLTGKTGPRRWKEMMFLKMKEAGRLLLEGVVMIGALV